MLDFLFGVLSVILAVWVVRRLLDLERGRWVTTLVAVLIGETCAVIVLRAVFKSVTGHRLEGRLQERDRSSS